MTGLRWSFALAIGVVFPLACDESLDAIVAVDGGVDGEPRTPGEASTRDGTFGGSGESEETPCRAPDSFTPIWRRPTPFHQGRCSEEQVDALLCLFDGGGDAGNCAAVVDDPVNDDCFQCIYTASSSKELGPVIITGSLGSVNIAGCIANAEGNVTDEGCGAALQALEQCERVACDCNMPVPEGWVCAADAGGYCATFAPAASCADALLAPDGAAYECRDSGTMVETARRVAKLFCVSASTDAGSDATTD